MSDAFSQDHPDPEGPDARAIEQAEPGASGLPDPEGFVVGSALQVRYAVEPVPEQTSVIIADPITVTGPGEWRLILTFVGDDVPPPMMSGWVETGATGSNILDAFGPEFAEWVQGVAGDIINGMTVTWDPELDTTEQGGSATALLTVEENPAAPIEGPDAPYSFDIAQVTPHQAGVKEPGWVEPSGASAPSGGIQMLSGQGGANFPWLLNGEILLGTGSVSYVWRPAAGNDIAMTVGLLNAPIADVPILLGLTVTNLDGTEQIQVLDSTGVTVTDEGILTSYGLTAAAEVIPVAGTDLSYDTDTHEVTSAAGGVYFVQAVVFISND